MTATKNENDRFGAHPKLGLVPAEAMTSVSQNVAPDRDEPDGELVRVPFCFSGSCHL